MFLKRLKYKSIPKVSWIFFIFLKKAGYTAKRMSNDELNEDGVYGSY